MARSGSGPQHHHRIAILRAGLNWPIRGRRMLTSGPTLDTTVALCWFALQKIGGCAPQDSVRCSAVIFPLQPAHG